MRIARILSSNVQQGRAYQLRVVLSNLKKVKSIKGDSDIESLAPTSQPHHVRILIAMMKNIDMGGNGAHIWNQWKYSKHWPLVLSTSHRSATRPGTNTEMKTLHWFRAVG